MNSAWPLAVTFASGMASGFGPCLVPRAATLSGLLGADSLRRRAVSTLLFVGGLCCGYVALASAAGAVQLMAATSSWTYALLAALLLAAGIATIVRHPRSVCATSSHRGLRLSSGAVMLAGFASVGAGTSCCGPIGLLLAGVSGGWGDAADSAAAFALGHAVPLVTVVFGYRGVTDVLASRIPEGAMATVTGALSLAFAAYYALMV